MSKSRHLLLFAVWLRQFETFLSSLSWKNTLEYQQPVTSEFATGRCTQFFPANIDCKYADNHQGFIYSPADALVSCLKNNIKIYIKIYIKTTPTCFGVTVIPSSGSALICAY